MAGGCVITDAMAV